MHIGDGHYANHIQFSHKKNNSLPFLIREVRLRKVNAQDYTAIK